MKTKHIEASGVKYSYSANRISGTNDYIISRIALTEDGAKECAMKGSAPKFERKSFKNETEARKYIELLAKTEKLEKA